MSEQLPPTNEPDGEPAPITTTPHPLAVAGLSIVAVILIVAVVWAISSSLSTPEGGTTVPTQARVPDMSPPAEVTESTEQPDRNPFAAPEGAIPPPEIAPAAAEVGKTEPPAGDLEPVAVPAATVAPPSTPEPPAVGELPPADLERPGRRRDEAADRPPPDEPPPPEKTEPEAPAPPTEPDPAMLAQLDPTGEPTWASPDGLKAAGVSLQAIVQGRRPTAVFRLADGYHRVCEGDTVGDYKVERIRADVVYLLQGRRRYAARLSGPRVGGSATAREAAGPPAGAGPFASPLASPATTDS